MARRFAARRRGPLLQGWFRGILVERASVSGPQLWCWTGFLFIVLVIVLVVVLDLFGLRQPGSDYEDENEDEDD